MKHKILILGISLTLLVGMCCSCDKYLDLKSNASYVVPRTLEDIQGLLDDADMRMNLNVAPSLGESVADDYYVPSSTLNGFTESGRALYVWQPFEYTGHTEWGFPYTAVYNANLALELLEKIERTKTNAYQWDNIRGSALFFRAFQFLALVGHFGHAFDESTADRDLGIVLRLSADVNQKSVRATVRECYDRILRDLEESLVYLPDHPVHVMRPSKGAAYGLLARTHLYMRQYEKALYYADQALGLNSRLMDFNGDPDISSLTANLPFSQFNKETVFYAHNNGSHIYNNTRGIIDTLLYRSYEDGDLRKTGFFRLTGGQYYFKGNYSGSSAARFSGISVAELYLTRAECYAFLDNIQAAMADINTLLVTRWDNRRAYVPKVASDRLHALEIVRTERRKELLIRNMRWMDIKRYNKEGAGIVLRRIVDGVEYTLQPNASFYALPLPRDIVELTGIPQN